MTFRRKEGENGWEDKQALSGLFQEVVLMEEL